MPNISVNVYGEISLVIVGLFFIPCISTNIYISKFVKESNKHTHLLMLGVLSALDVVFTYLLVDIVGVFTGLCCNIGTLVFSLFEILTSLITPFLVYFIVNRFDVNVEIKHEK